MSKYIVIILLFIISCSSPKWATIGQQTITTRYQFNKYQFDSLTVKDSLDNFINIPLRDYETREIINKYMCIKDSTIYTILQTDSCYYVEIRVNK